MAIAQSIHAQEVSSIDMMFTSEADVVTSEVQMLTTSNTVAISSMTTTVEVMSSATMATPISTTETPSPTPTTSRNPCQACGATAICVTIRSTFYCQCRQGYYIRNESVPIEDNQSGTNCLAGITYSGNLAINKPFTPQLSNKNSTEYKNLTSIAKQKLESTLRQQYGNTFERVVIHGVRNGSIIFDYNIIMKSNATTNVTSIDSFVKQQITSLAGAPVTSSIINASNVCIGNNRPCISTNQVCIAENGGFSCRSCPTGYGYNNATNTCHEINECATQPSICHNQNRSCINSDGSYFCVPCTDLKIYDRVTRQCVERASCSPNPCLYAGTCVLLTNANSFSCGCIIFFNGDRCQHLSDIGIAIIATGSTVIVLVILAITTICCYANSRRKGVKRPDRSRQETGEQEQIVMDKLLRPQLRTSSSEVDVPKRPYDGAIGGEYTTVTYEDRQMLTRSKVFED